MTLIWDNQTSLEENVFEIYSICFFFIFFIAITHWFYE